MTVDVRQEVRTATADLNVPFLNGDTVLVVRPLTVVADADEFLVGDPERSTYVLLPPIAVEVLELLRAGCTLDQAAAHMLATSGDVDVIDFGGSLIELGFATPAGSDEDTPMPQPTWWARHVRPEHARPLFSRPAWFVYGLCALGVVAIFIGRPQLFPSSSDVFFLATPAQSVAVLTLIAYGLATMHEGCHWLGARAEGVTARFAVSRRLYILTFESDLTQLWSVPRPRRYGALLAGMAFDGVVLFAVLMARLAGLAAWWRPGHRIAGLLAAVTLVQVSGICLQFWVFMRTDVYAVLVVATGCTNLSHVNRLVLRRKLRLLTADEENELAGASSRDRAVARWYVWVYAAGIALATAFFAAVFIPATVHTVGWIAQTVGEAQLGSAAFWEAVALGGIILSPYLLTAGVAMRDLRRRAPHRGASRSGTA